MPLMILPAEEDGENAYGLLAFIDIEIKDHLIFCDPTKAGQQFWHQCSLKRRFAERLHIRLDIADSQSCPLESLRQAVAKILIGLNEMVENEAEILIRSRRTQDLKGHS